MTETEMPDGSWEYTLDPEAEEDIETIKLLTIIAKQKKIKLNTPEFNELFTELLTDMMENPEFLKKIKEENKGTENEQEKEK